MSPLRFALANRTLAVALGSSLVVRAFSRGVVEEKVPLYVDDLLIFQEDMQTSQLKAMEIIKHFCQFSGLTINWEKSLA